MCSYMCVIIELKIHMYVQNVFMCCKAMFCIRIPSDFWMNFLFYSRDLFTPDIYNTTVITTISSSNQKHSFTYNISLKCLVKHSYSLMRTVSTSTRRRSQRLSIGGSNTSRLGQRFHECSDTFPPLIMFCAEINMHSSLVTHWEK